MKKLKNFIRFIIEIRFCGFSDLLGVPASEGEVLQRGADGALLLGTLQSSWQKHNTESLGLASVLRHS